jgi:hypothetical protein
MANLDVGFLIWRCPSIFMDVAMLTARFSDVAKFTTLTPLSLLILLDVHNDLFHIAEWKKYKHFYVQAT